MIDEAKDNLVMRSYYVDAEVEQELDDIAWRNKANKAEYIRLALDFAVKILKKDGGNMTPKMFKQELDKL